MINEEATRANIQDQLAFFASDSISGDDRVFVYFAGHGFTRKGNRNEVGFLVPHDGTPENLSTLIPWRELTSCSELIPAKHMFFVMDACYGGLALTRGIKPGTMRFATDMLQRYGRQVLTAGKGDQVVLDGDGPRDGHSLFTGYFLEALEGKFSDDSELLTAQTTMGQVYNKVANDYNSIQTPHYGFFDGDGDFIFNVSMLEDRVNDNTIGQNEFYSIPDIYISEYQSNENIESIKEYLADSKYRIKLHDTVSAQIRTTLKTIENEKFDLDANNIDAESVSTRLKSYEGCISELLRISILLGKWGGEEHQYLIENILLRMSENLGLKASFQIWRGMEWYPNLLLMYGAGIAATSSKNYTNLLSTFLPKTYGRINGGEKRELLVSTTEGILELQRAKGFKILPGHERHHVPKSEYMYKILQPYLEESLFLGRNYEIAFDEFEILAALAHADLTFNEQRRLAWGPVGRFLWKYNNGRQYDDPFNNLKAEAASKKNGWLPLQHGMFGGNFERYEKIVGLFEEHVLKR